MPNEERHGRGKNRKTPLKLFTASILTTLAIPIGVAPAAVADDHTRVVNGGFEDGLNGWTVEGATAKLSSDAYEGAARLDHWLAAEGEVTTSQEVTGLEEGWWTVSAKFKSGGEVNSSRVLLEDCGVDGETVIPSTTKDNGWLTISADAYVTDGSCEIVIETKGAAGSWAGADNVTLEPGQVSRTIRGGDLSSLAKNEDYGAEYFTADGTPVDPVEAFANAGMNMGRLKVWVNPADGYNDKDDVVETAKRIKAAGMKLLVDFHYSDTWADPGAQHTPEAWKSFTVDEMAQAVYDHTHEVLTALEEAGITADAVQVGNEINPGMLWPQGQTYEINPDDGVTGAQWDNLAKFLTAGHNAVKDVNAETEVILHLTNINNGIDSLTWWYDNVVQRGVPFDIIGLSYYGFWHGSFADLQNAITVLSARYDRDVLVVENAYPFILADDTTAPAAPEGWENIIRDESQLYPDYPASPEGQAAHFRAVQDVVASAPGGRGLGVVYWEPAWTAVEGSGWNPADPDSGNAWENQAMFDFEGRALPVLQEYAPDPQAPGPQDPEPTDPEPTTPEQTVAALQGSLDELIASGDVTRPASARLDAMLRQTGKFIAQSRPEHAAKFLERFIGVLEEDNRGRDGISDHAHDVLGPQAQSLLSLLQG